MRPHSRFQFRLRTIFVAMLFVALLTPWYGQTVYNSLQNSFSSIWHWRDSSSNSSQWRQAMFEAETILDDVEVDDVFIGFPPSNADATEATD